MCIDSIPQGYKTCRKCGEIKTVAEFNKDNNQKDGLYSYCRACQSLQARQWREAYPEKARGNTRQWNQANSDKVRAHNRLWYKANSKKRLETVRQYQQANPEKARENYRRRRARKNGIVWSVPTNIEEILFDVQNGYCIYCQCELLNGYHLDHIVPLVLADLLGRDYPGHVPTNLCLACEHCNLSKQDALLEDWLAWKYPDQMDEILHRVERHIEIMKEWE